MTPVGREESLGSVGEEAARLLDAMQDWARSRGVGSPGDDSPGSGGQDGDPAAASGTCQLCPLCQLLGVLRQTRPEVFDHLADATASLTAAVRGLVPASERQRESEYPDPTGRRAGVERIDISEG